MRLRACFALLLFLSACASARPAADAPAPRLRPDSSLGSEHPAGVEGQAVAQGTVVVTGLIQLVADGDVHAWTGEVDANGKTLRDEVGAILPDHGASLD